MPLITWRITKRLSGVLDGIEVTDTLTEDMRLGAPFTPGELVKGIGCDYTVIACEPVEVDGLPRFEVEREPDGWPTGISIDRLAVAELADCLRPMGER